MQGYSMTPQLRPPVLIHQRDDRAIPIGRWSMFPSLKYLFTLFIGTHPDLRHWASRFVPTIPQFGGGGGVEDHSRSRGFGFVNGENGRFFIDPTFFKNFFDVPRFPQRRKYGQIEPLGPCWAFFVRTMPFFKKRSNRRAFRIFLKNVQNPDGSGYIFSKNTSISTAMGKAPLEICCSAAWDGGPRGDVCLGFPPFSL